MAIDEQAVLRAARGDRRAMEAVLADVYPAVHRMAHGLAGRADVARGVIRFIINHAPRQMPRWHDEDAPRRWCCHHTVLTARRAVHGPNPKTDLLYTSADDRTPEYAAFVAALRQLPRQQQEAFVLHYGERLTLRTLAITMDCSTKAAQQHLEAADNALRPLSAQFDAMLGRMRTAYHRLGPAEQSVEPLVKRTIARALLPRHLRRLILLILLLVLAAAVLWGLSSLAGLGGAADVQ